MVFVGQNLRYLFGEPSLQARLAFDPLRPLELLHPSFILWRCGAFPKNVGQKFYFVIVCLFVCFFVLLCCFFFDYLIICLRLFLLGGLLIFFWGVFFGRPLLRWRSTAPAFSDVFDGDRPLWLG